MAQREQMVAFWLVPARDEQQFFSSLIDLLAVRFSAQRFEPHVTLFGGHDIDANRADEFLREVASCAPIELQVEGIEHSEEFTKTLFVQFRRSPEAEALSKSIRAATGSKKDYQLRPHLSLLYKHLPEHDKAELAESLELPLESVTCDVVKVISGNPTTNSSEDVASWRTLAERRLKR